eukprot:9424622-Alexandrium_andersonii.AAC.1
MRKGVWPAGVLRHEANGVEIDLDPSPAALVVDLTSSDDDLPDDVPPIHEPCTPTEVDEDSFAERDSSPAVDHDGYTQDIRGFGKWYSSHPTPCQRLQGPSRTANPLFACACLKDMSGL